MNNTIETWEFVESSPYMRALHHNFDGTFHIVFSDDEGQWHITNRRDSMREACDEARQRLAEPRSAAEAFSDSGSPQPG